MLRIINNIVPYLIVLSTKQCLFLEWESMWIEAIYCYSKHTHQYQPKMIFLFILLFISFLRKYDEFIFIQNQHLALVSILEQNTRHHHHQQQLMKLIANIEEEKNDDCFIPLFDTLFNLIWNVRFSLNFLFHCSRLMYGLAHHVSISWAA